MTHRLNIIGCALMALLLTACYEETMEDLGVVQETTAYKSYIALSFSVPSRTTTRSAENPPQGGEWGDGRERGQSYENTVNTAAVFLYQDEGGVNGKASTPVTMVYFDTVNGQQNTTDNIDYLATTEPRSVALDDGHYDVLAIANPGDMSWAQSATLTLGEVRDHIEKAAWTESNGTYASFLMTSENEGEGVDIDSSCTRENPAVAVVDVERMAARVDYQTTGEYTITGEEDDDTYAGATVEITGAAIVNNLTAGSYLLKRVNSGYGDACTYLGEETADNDYKATNYVIDPWTEEKNGADEVTIDGTTSDVSSLFGIFYPGVATNDEEQNPSFWADLVTSGTPLTDDDGTTWNRIGYTMENTTYADYTNKKYNTGAVFAALFTPAEGTVKDSFYKEEGFAYEKGNTFFKWNNVLYATAEDMMAVAYPETFVINDRFGATTFENISTLEDLNTFVATLRDDDPTGYKIYLESITTFPTTSPSDLYWETYMENECGYKFDTTSGVTLNAFDIETTYSSTRAALAAYTDDEVSTYENAQCYYTWWIRHSDDDSDETNGVMEYAIVRNNIYKLQIASVYSIGGDIPREGLRIHVYVKDWTMLDEEIIDL